MLQKFETSPGTTSYTLIKNIDNIATTMVKKFCNSLISCVIIEISHLSYRILLSDTI